MFKNIGKKIKVFAVIAFGVKVLFFVLDLFNGIESGYFEKISYESGTRLMLGTVVESLLNVFVLPLLAYGFGEIVEKISKIEQSVTASALGTNRWKGGKKVKTEEGENDNDFWECTCGKINPPFRNVCSCGNKKEDVIQ